MELMQASNQWMTRPDDERFTSLTAMRNHFDQVRQECRETTVSSRKIHFEPVETRGLVYCDQSGKNHFPTHWAFGQLATLAEAPAGYLRTLPAPIAADCLNYGLQFKRQIEDVGLLLQSNGANSVRAATGPKYGRIWNNDILAQLIARFGDGVSGAFRVPGEFGRAVVVTKENTTLFAGDRDFFVFLADEQNRIEIPNRRDGQPGTMARGFFVWNSETGARTLGVATFLFDYVCCNRIVWGASEYKEIRIRHTVSAPDKFVEEIGPALESYAQSSTASITKAITDAREKQLGDKLDDFLANRFGKRIADKIKLAHTADEGRPIETLWDAVTGATAYARSLGHQDARVDIERKAGDILDLVAA